MGDALTATAPDVAAGPLETGSLDAEALRRDFPALHQEVHGCPLVYLDNAATTHKPQLVIDAVEGYYRRDCSNVHRGVHSLSQRATAAYEKARETVRRFLGAASEREIVFVKGATEGINLVARSFLAPRLGPGDEVLVTAMEHHANIVPWQIVCEEKGARLRVIPMDERGALVLDGLDSLFNERTRMLAAVHVSNALGTVNPVEDLAAAARERGVPVLFDGAQAVPHLAVDVQALGCDFYVFSGHKVFGPTGIGVLWGRLGHLETMPPYQGGGDMILTVSFEKTTFNRPPHRFEAGTPHIAGAIGLSAALEYLQGVGLGPVAAYEAELLAYATEQVRAVPGIRLVGTAPQKASVLSFVVEGVHPHDVGTILDQSGVAVRAGHHCAQPVMAHFGVAATVRASFTFYNTRREVDALVAGLRQVQEIFG
jgi:cysteine desulfurase / selenocysteine lyase